MADDPADTRSGRFRAGEHLRREQARFRAGDLGGPTTIHGPAIPGTEVLRAGVDHLEIAGVPLSDVQEAASHADPRTNMRHDRARQSLGRHATYIVATFVAGASRGDAAPGPRQR